MFQSNSIKSYLQPKISSGDFIFINSFIKGIKLSNIEWVNRIKYYYNHCHLVEPQEVLLGTELIKFKGNIKEVKRCGYYIPLQKTLQALLNLPEVNTAVMTPHYSESSMMKEICIGTYIRTHPLFSKDSNALAIVLNYDDVEIVNPLGSHIKKQTNLQCFIFLWQISHHSFAQNWQQFS